MPRLTETRALRATLPQTGQRLIWCSEIIGLGVRLLPTGVRSWIVRVTYLGKQHRLTLGPVGTLSFETPDGCGAADLAKIALNAGRRGEDPRVAIGRAKHPAGVSLTGIWDAFHKAGHPLLNKVGGTKRASSIKTETYRWNKHFADKIAHEPPANFDDVRVQRWLDGIKGVGAKSHCLITLKGLLSFGASRGMCERHRITLTATPSRRVQNFLKADELKRLDAALIDLAREQPERMLGFAALRLLLHTGMRKGEVLTLTWSMVDLEHRVVHLERDKASGEERGRDVLLTDAAVEVLRSLPRIVRVPWVFPGRRREGHLIDLEFFWEAALKRAKLRRIRIHDLRHSHASLLIANGTSLYVCGKLLGHKSSRTTERYGHLANETLRAEIDKAGGALS